MQKLGLFGVGVLISLAASARDCASVHTVDVTIQRVLRQVQKLNPEIKTTSSQDLYLELKKEEWTYHPIPLRTAPRHLPLPEYLKDHIVQENQKSFRTENLSGEDLTRFYVNGLRNQYSRVAEIFREQEIQRLAEGRESEFADELLQILMSSKRLSERELSPETAAEIFQNKDWRNFPFLKAVIAVEQFKASGMAYSRSNFQTWLEQNTDFSAQEMNVVVKAMERTQWKPAEMCCRSASGCFDCPLNRRWRRDDRSDEKP